ncbi:MAG: threonine--tRNA ligase [Candidatus Nealsonbacteria bacterium]|nr:threonine--tRNA ligase [Candidatus Nealsonbacteria bacterium]
MSKDKKKEEKLEKIRHSLSHIMAEAIQKLYPGVKFGIGPAIENGFYYDLDLPSDISSDDIPKVEKEMKRIIKEGVEFKQKNVSEKEAKEIFKDQPYKLELIEELEDEKISVYESGDFIDLCKGPHVGSSKEINPKAFMLTNIAGAYWRGDEKNKMLTRIYGVAFDSEKELNDFLKLQEEAQKRDHRKLGEELDLFCFSDLVGPGLPLYTPKGTFLKDELQKKVEKICRRYGFEKVFTPHLAKIKLYELSGHAKKFGDELFHVSSGKGHEFVLRPVQCPHQTQIYASKMRSYRDLPIRYMESDRQYRAEKPGEVGGLSRVYAITVEDGHSFCEVSQVKDEVKGMVNIIKDFYSSLGLWGNHGVSLSVRDYDHPEKYIGEKEDWDQCEQMLQEVSEEMKLDAERREGEAALYGPKLDFMFKDALGKEIQIPTVQVDFATPKRFDLFYIDNNGQKKHPVMVHRAILGSYERFLALIIEHFAGAFPLWLAPEQMWVIPVSENHAGYAKKVHEELLENNLRSILRDDNETVSKKIREGEVQKIPYLLVVGDREIKSNSVSPRYKGEDLGEMKLTDFIKKAKIEVEEEK